jgi:hypothetical protein
LTVDSYDRFVWKYHWLRGDKSLAPRTIWACLVYCSWGPGQGQIFRVRRFATYRHYCIPASEGCNSPANAWSPCSCAEHRSTSIDDLVRFVDRYNSSNACVLEMLRVNFFPVASNQTRYAVTCWPLMDDLDIDLARRPSQDTGSCPVKPGIYFRDIEGAIQRQIIFSKVVYRYIEISNRYRPS